MTDAASKKVNKADMMQGQMRTTHPSYTEYSWNTLVRQPQQPRPQTHPPQTVKAHPQSARPQSARPQPAQARQQSAQPQRQTRAQMFTAQTYPTGANPRQSAYQPSAYKTATAGYAAGRPGYPHDTVAGHAAAGPRGFAQDRRSGQNIKTGGAQTYPGQRTGTGQNTSAKVRTIAEDIPKRAARIRTKSITTLHTIVSEKRYSFPVSIVLIALSITFLILAIVTASVRISEITTENSTLQNTYNSLVADENELRLQLETRDDLRVVESMAKNELGMVKKDQVKKYYLTVHKKDRIELVEETEENKTGLFDGLLSFGGSIVERVRAFFGL